MPTTQITLRTGETYVLRLQSRGSAGYSWGYELSGNGGVVEVSIRGAGDPPPQTSSGPPAPYSADEQLFVKALSVGDVTIHLSLRRPWERAASALAEKVLSVSVHP